MPVGPSHSGRGGGGGYHGGPRPGGGYGGPHGPRHEPHHSPSSSFVNGMIGGMIGASIANRRRERFVQRYGIRPNDEEFDSMPRRTKPTGFLVMAIIVAMITFFSVIIAISSNQTAKEYKQSMQIMEADWKNDYKPMLEKVGSSDFVNGTNNYYIVEAEFSKSKFSSYYSNPSTPACYEDFSLNNIIYYFVVYKYQFNGQEYKGTTYTSFLANQLDQLNGKIKIAIFDNGTEHFSINTSYNLDSNAEYEYYKSNYESASKSAKGHIVPIVIEVLLIALFVTLYVLRLKKYYKLVADDEEILFQKKKAEADKATAEANEVKSRTNRFCRYCGAKLDPNSTSCSGCGAKITK